MNIEKKSPVVNYPEEFLIACGIHRLRPEELLQEFANRFHYAGLMCGAEDDTDHAVNEVVYDYLHHTGAVKSVANSDKWYYNTCMLNMEEIVNEYYDCPEDEIKRVIDDVILEEMEDITENEQLQTAIIVSGGHTITLSNNFIMTCVMYGICPESIFQHLVDNISLAKEAAMNPYGIIVFNPFMTFFDRMVKQFNHYSLGLQTADFYQHEKEITALHVQLGQERDFEKRLCALTKHFKAWYDAMQKVKPEKVNKLYGKSKKRTVTAMR